MPKNVIKLFLLTLLSCTCLTSLSGCSKESVQEEIDESKIPLSERKKDYKYDFLDYLDLGIVGADGVAVIKVSELRQVKAKEFETEEDFIKIKQILSEGSIEIDKTENLKNGDEILIEFETDIKLNETDKNLINMTPYTYTISTLEKGTSYDLKEDVVVNLYSFESIDSAKKKQRENEDYEMIIEAIPSMNSHIKTKYLGGLLTDIYTDTPIFEYGETLYSLSYGFSTDYIVNNKLTLTHIDKNIGLKSCSGSIDGEDSCFISQDNILKKTTIAELPKFNYVDKETLKVQVLSFVNARIDNITRRGVNLSHSELPQTKYDNVHGIYKYNYGKIQDDEHSEMYKYRYGVLVSGKNTDDKIVYSIITFGMLQDGDYIGLFTNNEGDLEITMIGAGYTKEDVLIRDEHDSYTLTSEILM